MRRVRAASPRATPRHYADRWCRLLRPAGSGTTYRRPSAPAVQWVAHHGRRDRRAEDPMARMMIDCRTMPSESGCSLTIAGEPEEVLRAAVIHAVDVHGHTDDQELRDGIRSGMVPAPVDVGAGTFVQVIDFTSDDV